jgi:hypothetical protein
LKFVQSLGDNLSRIGVVVLQLNVDS